MKKLCIMFCLVLLLSLFGCHKSGEEKATEHPATLALLNPDNAGSDESITSSFGTFKEKGFKLLGENYWLSSEKPRYIAVFSKPGNGSHASSAEVGALYAEYNEAGRKWEIKAESLSFTSNGAWGEAPTPRFIRLGRDRYGFMMDAGFTGQGYSNTTTTLYGVVGSNFVEMLSVPTEESNAGTGDESYVVKVKLKQQLDDKKEAYDIVCDLTTDGNHQISPDDPFGKTFGRAGRLRYVFANGAYQPEKQK